MAERDTYHHGDLKAALAGAAEQIVRAEGIEDFSLRKVARMVGVSAGAATYHFGSVTRLLTEVAILAYRGLGQQLAQVARTGAPGQDLRAIATCYVTFASSESGRFRLMGRKDLVDYADQGLVAASFEALRPLRDAATSYVGASQIGRHDTEVDPAAVAIIATAHGLAHMTVEGRWSRLIDAQNPDQDFYRRLLPAILQSTWPDLPQRRDGVGMEPA